MISWLGLNNIKNTLFYILKNISKSAYGVFNNKIRDPWVTCGLHLFCTRNMLLNFSHDKVFFEKIIFNLMD